MRFALLLLIGFALPAQAKVLHVRYRVHAADQLTEEQRLWAPERWDLYVGESAFRLEETGGAGRVWVGELGGDAHYLLLTFFGEDLALLEPCAEGERWRKAGEARGPIEVDAAAPVIAGVAAEAFEAGDQFAWLTADRTEALCMWGFPRLPLAFAMPDGDGAVWMVAESMGESEASVAFQVPEGHRLTTRSELGLVVPALEPVD